MESNDGRAASPSDSGWITRLRRAFGGGRSRRKVDSLAESAPPAPATSSCTVGIPAMESVVPIDCTPQQFKMFAEGSRLSVSNVPHAKSTMTNKTAISQTQSSRSYAIPGVEKKLKSLFHVPDNRVTLKLFGSKNGIQKEEERRKNCRHWVIHPCSKFR